ncbi:SciM protein [Pseudovibrio sp. FO-BEG1]|uniref:Hcp family type VI secretion system effector n=1 Tax=Pseudovibrio sp. (strain FO-BEG1) TaxID=911045 RepID=UPI000238CA09|nr:type VI secretion system tube protein Hcp [Pseudovibrio sp. FO-BEG1]AEV37368.1 SciM protein [Pseudovibrio sp. FO-BEG1]
MAIDAYVIFEGPGAGAIAIEGETQDDEMAKKKAFEITTFSMGAENTMDIGSMRGGSGAGRVKFKEFQIEKKSDRGSPGLFLACCNGGIYKTVTLILRRSGGASGKSGVIFLTFTMKLVAIKEISWEGNDEECKESIQMEYGAVEINYTMMDTTGAMGKTLTEKWSRIKNTRDLAVE